MIAIRAEIDKVGAGDWPPDDNPLRDAPHTAGALVGDSGTTRTRARWRVYPGRGRPTARQVLAAGPPHRPGAYGDRNLVCSCPPLEACRGLIPRSIEELRPGSPAPDPEPLGVSSPWRATPPST